MISVYGTRENDDDKGYDTRENFGSTKILYTNL